MGITLKPAYLADGYSKRVAYFEGCDIRDGYVYTKLPWPSENNLKPVRYFVGTEVVYPQPLTLVEQMFLLNTYDVNYSVELVTVANRKIIVVHDAIPIREGRWDATKHVYMRQWETTPVWETSAQIRYKPVDL